MHCITILHDCVSLPVSCSEAITLKTDDAMSKTTDREPYKSSHPSRGQNMHLLHHSTLPPTKPVCNRQFEP
jgi:hypothetical protein